MQITEVIVSAGRTFNHPYENYSNLRPGVTIKAVLQEGDDSATVIKDLQARAEELVENHKQHLLASLEELERLTKRQQEVSSLEENIKRAQDRLDHIRSEFNLNPQLEAGDPERGDPGRTDDLF